MSKAFRAIPIWNYVVAAFLIFLGVTAMQAAEQFGLQTTARTKSPGKSENAGTPLIVTQVTTPIRRLPPTADRRLRPTDPRPGIPPEGFLPVPETLLSWLNELEHETVCSKWVAEVRELIQQVVGEKPGAGQQTYDALKKLRHAAACVEGLTDNVDSAALRTKWRRAGHALFRRVAIWDVIDEIYRQHNRDQQTRRDNALSLAFRVRARSADRAEASRGWGGGVTVKVKNRRQTDIQQMLADSAKQPRFASRQRPRQWKSANTTRLAEDKKTVLIDSLAVLRHVERYEKTRLVSDSSSIVKATGALLASTDPQRRELGKCLARQYRIANYRIALTEDFLNRFIPQPKPVSKEIDEQMFGVWVEGESKTFTHMRVKVIPDTKVARVGVEAQGEVESDTAANRGPATVFTEGATEYLVRKLVVIHPKGYWVFPSVAEAWGDANLVGVETKFDGSFLLGGMVRKMARRQHKRMYHTAREEMEERVAKIFGE